MSRDIQIKDELKGNIKNQKKSKGNQEFFNDINRLDIGKQTISDPEQKQQKLPKLKHRV